LYRLGLEIQKRFLYNARMTQVAQKKHIITIAGRPGSGKSTTSRAVAQRLGYEHFSSGDLFRAIGKERGIDVYQTNLVAEKEKDIDQLVDQKLRDIGATQDEVVIDSRLAWHWMPSSFKVFLNLDLLIAAQRILGKDDPFRSAHEHIPDDPAKYATILQDRLDSEARRYKKLYNANPYDTSNYDLVVDSGARSVEEVVEEILAAYRAWLQK
jgi:cytidylate kinase